MTGTLQVRWTERIRHSPSPNGLSYSVLFAADRALVQLGVHDGKVVEAGRDAPNKSRIRILSGKEWEVVLQQTDCAMQYTSAGGTLNLTGPYCNSSVENAVLQRICHTNDDDAVIFEGFKRVRNGEDYVKVLNTFWPNKSLRP
jgi:hypothetical protein